MLRAALLSDVEKATVKKLAHQEHEMHPKEVARHIEKHRKTLQGVLKRQTYQTL